MNGFQLAAAGVVALVMARGSLAQGAPEAVGRAAVVERAIAHGPRLAIARADSASARATVALARQYENPLISLGYSKATPQQHYAVDVPIDFPWIRDVRIAAAQAGLGAATYRFMFEREAVAYDADTTYTRALAARARARLSGTTARDADSLLALARVRRDAGDASELDVQLASVNAGQLANAAVTDSLEALTALLDVQAVMGIPADMPTIALADTLAADGTVGAGNDGVPLLLAAAQEDARSAEIAVALERRKAFPSASLSLGFDTHDPFGQENGTLPTIGLSFPVPLFNQNGASLMAAEAQRDRATAALALARIEVSAALARALRAAAVALERASRSQRLLAAANSVAGLSLLSYREGAAALASVLEAQRTARDAQGQYVTDIAAARNATGLVRLLRFTATLPAPSTRTDRSHP